MPLIFRLEVDRMRETVLHAFTQREVELTGMLDEALTKYLNAFDFTGEVEAQARILLPRLVEEAVRDALRRAMDGQEMRDYLQAVADRAVGNYLLTHKSEE